MLYGYMAKVVPRWHLIKLCIVKFDSKSLNIRYQASNHYNLFLVLHKLLRLLIIMYLRFQQTCFKHHNDLGLTSNYG